MIAREGACEEEEVKPGPIRPMYNGLGSVVTVPIGCSGKSYERGENKNRLDNGASGITEGPTCAMLPLLEIWSRPIRVQRAYRQDW